MSDRVAVKIESVSVSEEAGAAIQFVTLRDDAGRQMRVYIGKTEAQALALGLQEAVPDRPQTYEALAACLTALGAVVEEVRIDDLRAETFYAKVCLHAGERVSEVDMRPSDALNLAVRARCPLFVSESVLLASQPAEEPAEAPPVTVTRPLQEIVTLSADEVSEELTRLFTEDQADRVSWSEGRLGGEEIIPRDNARLARVKQLYRGQALQTGLEYFHAAMVLQHSSSAEDYLLAHEFCIVAISKGVEQAKWLAAASEDRFLRNIGRLQRFGTQYNVDASTGRWSVCEVSPEVEDSLRAALNVPTLLQAQIQGDERSTKPE